MTITQREKAERWDRLLRLLSSPSINDDLLTHLSGMRRATLMLLARREELPESLVAELKAYKDRLDALYLEAVDGFEDAEGVLNMIPAYLAGMLVGELCQPDTQDDDH
jgi:hypothetical protein